jgi:two-component system, OmpR family, phosphate regulon sensor histidine kinase PhoR
MRNPTLKSVILFCSLIVLFALGLQFYLIKRIHSSEAIRFNTSIVKSVQLLFHDNLLVSSDNKSSRLIIQPARDSYVIRYDSVPNRDLAVSRLVNELTEYDVYCNFHLSFREQGSPPYNKFVQPSKGSVYIGNEETGSMKQRAFNEYGTHLYLDFTGRQSYLLQSIVSWILSGLLLILSLAAIVIILYRFYKHRFWNGIQKEFVNNFMHEFRTPISVISIAGKVLERDGIEMHPSRLKKYAGIIKEQTDQLQNKVNQILSLALSGKKVTILEKRFVDVNSIVTRAISFVQPLVEEKRATIEFIPSGHTAQVYADTVYITQALVNLLDNSLKYANTPCIRMETAITEKICAISISDNGIGMEEKYIKHIFRKYYRIPTGNVHNVKGFGIGLNFVKNVVDAHNGRIEVSSTTGKGTEFRIKLPLT